MPRTSRLNTPRTVALSTTPALVSDSTTPWAMRRFRNTDASITVYWGNSSVTGSGATKGQELKAGEILEIDYTADPVWMVAASGTPSISVIEIG
jgi:hypothetical protein